MLFLTERIRPTAPSMQRVCRAVADARARTELLLVAWTPRLVDDRAVDQRAQLAANRIGGGRTHLGHEHDGEVLRGRDPERRGGGTAPVSTRPGH
jgi:hypothetical protein